MAVVVLRIKHKEIKLYRRATDNGHPARPRPARIYKMEFVFNTREELKKHVKQWVNEPRHYKILEDQNQEQEPKPQQTTTQYFNIQDPPTKPATTIL